MKIIKAQLLKIALPMKRDLATAFGVIRNKETLIIILHSDDGLVGYGECASTPAPWYTHESVDICFFVLQKYLVPQILHKPIQNPHEFVALYNNIVDNQAAKHGLESAFWDIYGQKQNKSLSQLFGGTRLQVSCGISIGLHKTIDETLDVIAREQARGFQRIKIKIEPQQDLKLLKAIREKFGDMTLSVDANASYTLEHINKLLDLDEFKLEMIEQPLFNDDLLEHSYLQKLMKTPLCLDESIKKILHAKQAIRLGSCKIINIKPGRVGGMIAALLIHDLAFTHNIGLWVGGMLETGIGMAYNLALASLPGFTYPGDIFPTDAFFHDDIVVSPYTMDAQGFIAISKKVGLGYEVDEEKLSKYTKKTWSTHG